MRVAFDSSSLRGQKTGIGVYTENLLRAFREMAAPVDIVELEDGATANQRVPFRIWREQVKIPSLASHSHAQILHLTGFAAPRHTAMPIVLTVHDLIGVLFAKDFPPVARLYWSRYLPFTVRFANHVITDSENTKRDLIRLTRVDPLAISVIPLGYSKDFHPLGEESTEATRRELGLPENFLLFVSTLEPRKGIDVLVKAFAAIAQDTPVDLVIVGKRGWYWQELFQLVETFGLTGRIHFIDYVVSDKLPALYNLARVFVFPSRYEGFGLTPLEAMACGTPVISSNAASLPEVIGEAGWLVPPDNTEELARAIYQITRNESLRADLRDRGLTQARKFSWERTARETLGVYENVLRQG